MKKILIYCLFFIGLTSLCAQTMNEEEAVGLAKEVLTSLQESKGGEIYENMNAQSQAAINEAQLNSIWVSLTMQLGSYKEANSWKYLLSNDHVVVTSVLVFEKMSVEYKIVFDNDNKIAGLWFTPIPPTLGYNSPAEMNESFYEKEITVTTGKYNLPGFLTLPLTAGTFPCVILVHGSGAHDRDETIGENQFFKDLAYGLAEKGIASVRYDKRTYVYKGESTEDISKFTVQEEVIDDVLSAIKLAASEQEINAKQLFIVGHSLGAMLAPRIAAHTDEIAGIIMMAGNASPLDKVLLDQLIYINGLEENPAMTEFLEKTRTQVDNMRKLGTSEYLEEIGLPLNMGEGYARDLNDYDQVEVAKKLKLPIFIMNGEKDYQVSMEEFGIWKRKLGKNKNVTFASYPGLGHLFMEIEGVPSPQNYMVAGSVSEKVIEDIASWIKQQI